MRDGDRDLGRWSRLLRPGPPLLGPLRGLGLLLARARAPVGHLRLRRLLLGSCGQLPAQEQQLGPAVELLVVLQAGEAVAELLHQLAGAEGTLLQPLLDRPPHVDNRCGVEHRQDEGLRNVRGRVDDAELDLPPLADVQAVEHQALVDLLLDVAQHHVVLERVLARRRQRDLGGRAPADLLHDRLLELLDQQLVGDRDRDLVRRVLQAGDLDVQIPRRLLSAPELRLVRAHVRLQLGLLLPVEDVAGVLPHGLLVLPAARRSLAELLLAVLDLVLELLDYVLGQGGLWDAAGALPVLARIGGDVVVPPGLEALLDDAGLVEVDAQVVVLSVHLPPLVALPERVSVQRGLARGLRREARGAHHVGPHLRLDVRRRLQRLHLQRRQLLAGRSVVGGSDAAVLGLVLQPRQRRVRERARLPDLVDVLLAALQVLVGLLQVLVPSRALVLGGQALVRGVPDRVPDQPLRVPAQGDLPHLGGVLLLLVARAGSLRGLCQLGGVRGYRRVPELLKVGLELLARLVVVAQVPVRLVHLPGLVALPQEEGVHALLRDGLCGQADRLHHLVPDAARVQLRGRSDALDVLLRVQGLPGPGLGCAGAPCEARLVAEALNAVQLEGAGLLQRLEVFASTLHVLLGLRAVQLARRARGGVGQVGVAGAPDRVPDQPLPVLCQRDLVGDLWVFAL
mmetsp:Transcript_57395/g.170796  ORF Transcript_57395/g.170796 Transcript_57395/m.170796 type:complete len:681 (+) Transcript_57395:731-2773(+)